jgi:cardiolipin synthase A/B
MIPLITVPRKVTISGTLLLLPLVLTQCSTPKILSRVGENQTVKIPVISHAGHVWRATAVSVARSPFRSARAGVLMAAQRARAFISGAAPLPSIKADTSGIPAPGSDEFEAFLDKSGLPPRTSGTVKHFVDGRRFFPEFLQDIERATTSINSQSFIFDNDDFGVSVADLFKKKSEQIPVRIFFDNLGTRIAHGVKPKTPPPPDFVSPGYMGKYLTKDSNIKLRTTTNPFLLCDHSKIHVIDHRIAWVGGMNIGREYRSEWHDQMARIEGPVVSQLEAVFQEHWDRENAFKNWTFQNLRHRNPYPGNDPPPPGAVPLRMLRTDTAGARYEIVRAFRSAIAGAKKRVWIESPYLAEDGIISDLADAARRGVQVRVIIPGRNDSGMMEKVNFQSALTLVQSGAAVYSYPGMTHLKVAVCDGWAMFGSANCDTISLRLNVELNLASSAPRFVRDLERHIFLPDFRVARPVTEAMCKAQQSPLTKIAGDQL